jgi:hypothetical protein
MVKNYRKSTRRNHRNRKSCRKSTRRTRRNMRGGSQNTMDAAMSYKSPFVTNMVRY